MANEKAGGTNLDILVVGAGISGINMGYRIQEGLPEMSYAILEGRAEMGGTWSLFKFPGIRSDSDLHTFGFPWDPWTENRAVADGPSILRYMKMVSEKPGIDKHIKYHHMVNKLEWKSDQQRWIVEVTVNGTEKKVFYSRFVVMGTGYYDYNEGLVSTIPGIENYKGTIVHPQFWPENLDYEDKKVVMIGSGATAVTILPAMADKVSHITMLQRSPGYFISLPQQDPLDVLINSWCPARWRRQLIRWKYMWMGWLMFQFCTWFPEAGKKMLRKGTQMQLPDSIPYDPHFIPSYDPWQQRMCLTPQGEFFKALHKGKADIVTDHIETMDDKGILLKSGKRLDADIVITATGLKVQLFGSAKVVIDGQPLDLASKFVWKGALMQDVPNFCFVFGYTNMSWTLGADATSLLFARLVRGMQNRGQTTVIPTIEKPGSIGEVPYLNLNSTYITKAEECKVMPKGGDSGPWKPRRNYFKDYYNAKWGDITTGLQFLRVSQ